MPPQNNKGQKPLRYRLSLVNDITHDMIWVRKFSRTRGVQVVVLSLVLLVLLVWCLIAYTPLRTFIPGYPDSASKRAAIQNAIRVDSLENVITRWDLYAENLRRTVEGQTPLTLDSLIRLHHKRSALSDGELKREDSLLRKLVASEEQFQINAAGGREQLLENLHFFVPVKGVVIRGFDRVVHPQVELSVPARSAVKAELDGTVVAADYSDTESYSLILQHEGNILSVYRGLGSVTRSVGDRVAAGAVLGFSDGKLHLGLWHRGVPVDPALYISF